MGNKLEFNRIIYERMRLGIMTALAPGNQLTFGELKEILKATDGNLSVHARLLEESGYIRPKKKFVGRKPRTSYQITAKGRKEFFSYLQQMEEIINTFKK